jgi:AcrR family transcriptional regulator
MFLERGFEAVPVAEIAKACDVSEKTVFNYFPTKESLVLDRWDNTAKALRAGLADTGVVHRCQIDVDRMVLTEAHQRGLSAVVSAAGG